MHSTGFEWVITNRARAGQVLALTGLASADVPHLWHQASVSTVLRWPQTSSTPPLADRLTDPKCKTWNKVGDMKLVPWPETSNQE